MLEIKNLLFQPLCLHLNDSNKSIHLVSRGKVAIQEKDLSHEIKKAQTKGWISIREPHKTSSVDSPVPAKTKKTRRA